MSVNVLKQVHAKIDYVKRGNTISNNEIEETFQIISKSLSQNKYDILNVLTCVWGVVLLVEELHCVAVPIVLNSDFLRILSETFDIHHSNKVLESYFTRIMMQLQVCNNNPPLADGNSMCLIPTVSDRKSASLPSLTMSKSMNQFNSDLFPLSGMHTPVSQTIVISSSPPSSIQDKQADMKNITISLNDIRNLDPLDRGVTVIEPVDTSKFIAESIVESPVIIKLIDKMFGKKGRVSAITGKVFGNKLSEVRSSVFRDVESVFELLSKDHDNGCVSGSQFRTILTSMGIGISDDDINELFQIASINEEVEGSVMISYKDFLLAGKLAMIFRKEKENKVAETVSGWISHQKQEIVQPKEESERLAVEEEVKSKLSWQSHCSWLENKRRDAALWLLRRANYVILKDDHHVHAVAFLTRIGNRVLAFDYLSRRAFAAAKVIQSRLDSRERLINNCNVALKLKAHHKECHYELCVMVAEHTRIEMIHSREIQTRARLDKLNCASQGKIWELGFRRDQAMIFLRSRAKAARLACETRRQTQLMLAKIANNYLKFTESRWQAHVFIVSEARRRMEHIPILHNAHQQLLTLTTLAVTKYTKWMNHGNSLFELGTKIRKNQDIVYRDLVFLVKLGQSKRMSFERMLDSFDFLAKRGKIAMIHSQAKQEAFSKLCSYSQKSVQQYRNIRQSGEYLLKRGKRAVQTMQRKQDAYLYLIGLVKQAKRFEKYRLRAANDLIHLGQDSRSIVQLTELLNTEEGKLLLKDQFARMDVEDKEKLAARKSMQTVDRFQSELADVFEAYDFDADGRIGKFQFRELLKEGRVVSMTMQQLDEAFDRLDPHYSGSVKFSDFLVWFRQEAKSQSKKSCFSCCFSCFSIESNVLSLAPRNKRAETKLMVSRQLK